MLLFGNGPQATIRDTGSTNRPGLRVTFDGSGHATVEQRNGEIQQIKLDEQLCNQFMRDLKDAAPLSTLPARHCAKSVSFGSSLFIEANGDKSPDLSCSPQADPKTDALRKDAQRILQEARQSAGIQPRKMVIVRAPSPPKS